MRRRIAIALLIVAVVGAAVFWLSQPKKGSVEWHKREYLEARDRLLEQTWMAAVRRFCARATHAQTFERKPEWRRPHWESFYRHEKALIDLGFLAKRTRLFHSYSTGFPGGMLVLPRWHGMSIYARSDFGTGVEEIVLIGLPDDMPKWEVFMEQMEREQQERTQELKRRIQLIQEREGQEQGRAADN